MGNRCYVAKVDVEAKEIELFYSHWHGHFDNVVTTLQVAKHLGCDFNRFVELFKNAFKDDGELVKKSVKIDDDFDLSDFLLEIHPYDNGVYLVDKNLNLRARFLPGDEYCDEFLVSDYIDTAKHIIDKNNLSLKSSDIKQDKLMFVDVEYISRGTPLDDFLIFLSPDRTTTDDEYAKAYKALDKTTQYLSDIIEAGNEDEQQLSVIEDILQNVKDILDAKRKKHE